MEKTIENTKDIPALTGIRTVAACMVFLAHFHSFRLPFFEDFLHRFFAEFHVGVTIFFVLSGFLIFYRYGDKIAEKKISLRDYFVNRFARIYPMYFIATLIAFLPIIYDGQVRENISVIFLNLTFLRGLFDEYKFTGTPTGWSLTVEEMFYCLFPLMIFAARKVKIIVQPLVFIGIGLILWFIFRNVKFHGFFSSLQFLFEFTFFGRCFEFYTGIQLALYIKRARNPIGSGRVNYRTACGAVYIIFCIWLLVLNRHYSTNADQFIGYETLVNNFLLPPGIALFFYGLMVERSLLRRILETDLFILLGKSSYIFYLIHNSIIFRLLYFNLLHEKLYFVFIALELLSILLYIGIEKPLNLLIRRKFAKGA